MKTLKKLFLGILFTIGFFAFAEKENKKLNLYKLHHDSEASVIVATGNTDSQTYSLKQETGYDWERSQINLTGFYLFGRAGGVESAKRWRAALRYDREIAEAAGLLLAYRIDGDSFAGFNSRHNADLGLKYSFLKNEATEVRAEAGYEFQSENSIFNTVLNSHFGRVYGDWKQDWNEYIFSQLWAEFLWSFTNSNDYRVNFEPSLNVRLNTAFAIKLAYVASFRNIPAAVGKSQWDGLYMTSLVAKF